MSRPHRDDQLEAYCSQLWQRHEAKGRPGMAFNELHLSLLGQPRRRDQPDNARAWLYAAHLMVEIRLAGADASNLVEEGQERPRRTNGAPALLGSLLATLERRTGEQAPTPPAEWRRDYFADLETMPLLSWYLSDERISKAIDLVAKQAGLTAYHKRVLGLWLKGDDVPAIAAEMHRRRPTIAQLLEEVLFRLCRLGQHRSGQCRHQLLEEAS